MTLTLEFCQTFLQQAYPVAQQPAVGFQLGFARATQADTTFLPLEVGPSSHQTRGQVFKLG